MLGAGLVGKRHTQHVLAEPQPELLAAVDPMPLGQQIARESGAKWLPSFAAMIETERPDGIIVATPNQVHIANEAEALGSSQIWILCPSHPPLSSEAPAHSPEDDG
ncbi:Gfo/Idh/MocA family oxidoreductase [Rhizobium leguminosarum]|uniref:Gfo/Idh/MocA family oxidoreductase n=1 Tax=Rhizobium leguminosarum TaxID=384 RepID=UPI00037F7B5D|nr:hypothetical protein [Rhizobium leguminosarum bv. viciae]NKL95246.1 hypothetical protein [Rhizobium leguminosarum bv. viciae]NKM93115.1 hypothetical protein [Rhizobium leguminosarum bv. viciae]NKM99960.1 hypothetical protein [Rhizobium leguminosarum bv. viciae]TBZ14349.1 hypothetical protein E0H38_20720 [Rhizobium leguminosarum bv. viciae]